MLERYGLKCGAHTNPGDEQVFVGLRVDRESGDISIVERKVWKLRPAVLHLLRRGRASGAQLRHVLGHFTWAAMMRRDCLAVAASCYSFVHAGVEEERPLWKTVQKELRWMAALAPWLTSSTRRPWSQMM